MRSPSGTKYPFLLLFSIHWCLIFHYSRCRFSHILPSFLYLLSPPFAHFSLLFWLARCEGEALKKHCQLDWAPLLLLYSFWVKNVNVIIMIIRNVFLCLRLFILALLQQLNGCKITICQPVPAGANASHNAGALNGIARIKRLVKTSGWGLIESWSRRSLCATVDIQNSSEPQRISTIFHHSLPTVYQTQTNIHFNWPAKWAPAPV